MEKFNNPIEFPRKPKSSPEKGLFAEAVEHIKTNDKAMKLLALVVDGYLPNQDELPLLDARRLLSELRMKYPTIEDIRKDLSEVIDEEIGVSFQKGWTPEEYEQAVKEKRLEYKKEALGAILSALAPVYEKYSASPSEENKARIFENLVTVIEKAKSGNISPSSKDYVMENLRAAANQKLTPDEARRIIQATQTFCKIWQQSFSEKLDPQIEGIIKKIKENSGLALEELRDTLGVYEKETSPERYELKGSKVIIDPGMLVEIYLANKRLQIIDVRDDPRWNADYLLIDPVTFDQTNPTEGFKGIRENEPFILGRDYPWRFKFPDTVSRAHLKIELKNGKLIIEDLNSTNGTVIEVIKPRRPSKKQIESQPASPEKERTLSEFKEYIKKHRLEIERKLQMGQDLDDIFYCDFYSSNIDQLKYRKDDPGLQKLVREYSNQINAVKADLSREAEKSRLEPAEVEDWFYCNINGGFRNWTTLGRFYLNLKPEYVGKVFLQAAKLFRDAGLHVQMKIPTDGNVDTFNRFDKMVIYFDAEEEKEVLQVLENLYQNNLRAFDDGVPRFTGEIKNQKGEKMIGIGFGQEPLFKNESFGSIRAKILAYIYRDAKDSGHSVSDPNFDFEESFLRACLKYQVDPQNPAFNLGGSEKFPEIMRRIG